MKPYKGLGMDGFIARWYARTRANDIESFREQARGVAAQLAPPTVPWSPRRDR
jgi:hypothetical protein